MCWQLYAQSAKLDVVAPEDEDLEFMTPASRSSRIQKPDEPGTPLNATNGGDKRVVVLPNRNL
jgi:hypothetical protein